MKRIPALLLLLTMLLTGCSSLAAKGPRIDGAGENCLSVWTSLEESVYEPLVKEFEDRTGIWVRVRTGSSRELLDAVPEGDCDVILGPDVWELEKCRDLFQEDPAALPEELAWGCPVGERWVPISLERLVLVYNPKLVRQNTPETWSDLASPIWQNQVSFADPGQCCHSRAFLRMLAEENLGAAFGKTVSSFADNLSGVVAGEYAVAEQLIRGSHNLAVLPEDLALRLVNQGISLAVVYPPVSCVLADGGAIPLTADHTENARAFLAFLLTPDAQRHAMEDSCRDSILREYSRIPRGARYSHTPRAVRLTQGAMEMWRSVRGEEP